MKNGNDYKNKNFGGNKMKQILNVAAGDMLPLKILTPNDFLVNLDLNYFNSITAAQTEELHRSLINNVTWCLDKPTIVYVNHDVYNFLERYTEKFDEVIMYRFLEHVPKVKILYFLYILSSCMRIGATMDVIVPNYVTLANRILNEKVNEPNFESEDIITTFELLNEPYCPHASIWTMDRVKYFLELEGRYSVLEMDPKFNFDGRDIYLRFKATRVK